MPVNLNEFNHKIDSVPLADSLFVICHAKMQAMINKIH